MKKGNLILSVLSLLTTTSLLICLLFGWYVSNEDASVSGIVGATETIDVSFMLQYYNETNSEWALVTELEKDNVQPGTTTYFRLLCTNGTGAPVYINGHFEGITSTLNTSYVTKSGDYCRYNGIPMYKVVSNKVSVPTGTLYNYSTSKLQFELADYKVEDGYMIEYFGSTETKTGAITEKADVDSDTMKGISGNILNSIEIPTAGTAIYFALTYIDDDDVNNYYMYQKLTINSLQITMTQRSGD